MTEGSHRQGITALTVAWLALLAVAAAGSTFVLLARQAPMPGSVSQPGLTVAIPGLETAGNTVDEIDDAADQAAAPADGPAAPSSVPPAPSVETPPASPILQPSQAALAKNSDLPAWRRYASIYQTTKKLPRIAVVLTGLGFSSKATEAAIQDLPPAVTLSFTPYAQKLAQWIAMARGNGHEVMLDLPMEPMTYPQDDPGPQALLTRLNELENQQRLRWVIGRAQGYVGLTAIMGSRFTSSEPQLKPVLREINSHGLMFLDNRESESSVVARVAKDLGLPHAVNDRTLDDGDVGHLTIDARLAQIERVALSEGASIAIGRPYPVTLERLAEWVKGLDSRGFELVPITVLAQDSR